MDIDESFQFKGTLQILPLNYQPLPLILPQSLPTPTPGDPHHTPPSVYLDSTLLVNKQLQYVRLMSITKDL